MKLLIELEMDGYKTKDEMREACIEFVKDQLNLTASSVKILWAEESKDFEW